MSAKVCSALANPGHSNLEYIWKQDQSDLTHNPVSSKRHAAKGETVLFLTPPHTQLPQEQSNYYNNRAGSWHVSAAQGGAKAATPWVVWETVVSITEPAPNRADDFLHHCRIRATHSTLENASTHGNFISMPTVNIPKISRITQR